MKISVALCTYNGEQYLREQLDSILNQSLTVDEVVVCDDGSTDQTINILNEYDLKYPNLFKINKNLVNLKSVKNFEKAISLCTGVYIYLSDQDDIWVKNKVQDYQDYFFKNPHINVLASNGFCINEKSEILDKYSVWDGPKFLNEAKVKFDFLDIITIISNVATGATMAFRAEIIDKICPFPVMKDFHHDEWIAIVASKDQSFMLLDEKYLYYRTHEKQQVGGIFYEKTVEKKLMLFSLFNYKNYDNISFKIYKRRLKKMSTSFYKNSKLANLDTQLQYFFTENLVKIETIFIENRRNMEKKYFLLFYLLYFTDLLTGKRKLSLQKNN